MNTISARFRPRAVSVVRHQDRQRTDFSHKETGMKIMIDPPSGWMYGFPRVYDASQDGPMRDFLLAAGYPQQDVDFALQHMRSWAAEEQ